jgi:hypothetical protein
MVAARAGTRAGQEGLDLDHGVGRIAQASGEGQPYVAPAAGPLEPEHDAVTVEPQRVHTREARSTT